MKTKTVKGVNISVLSLGTVQLGLNYGVNNHNGKPDQAMAFEILDSALQHGINALDTAIAYGDSEAVIGKWLNITERAKHPFVMTKVRHLDHSSLDALRRDVRTQVAESKERLGLKQLPLLMLHSCDDYVGDEENVTRVFQELKESGDIRFSGISAYGHHDYGKIAASGFDAVQIPVNIFDWTQIESGGMKKLEESGMMIFVRSVYLQGLIFQDPDKLDPRMEFCRETLAKFRKLCEKYQMSPAALALSYALSLPGVTSLVLGSETVEQVEQNVALVERVPELSKQQMEEIRQNFLDTDSRVLNPNTWYNA